MQGKREESDGQRSVANTHYALGIMGRKSMIIGIHRFKVKIPFSYSHTCYPIFITEGTKITFLSVIAFLSPIIGNFT